MMRALISAGARAHTGSARAPARQRSLASRARAASLLDWLGLESSASHAEVRRAYLQEAMRIHPDRRQGVADAHDDFAALQVAWERYQVERPRNFRRRRKVGDDEDPARQLFGVGCSWTDNDTEREERAAVMEQAARGITHRDTLEAGGGERQGR